MVEMVCLHVISLMEALQECNSTIFVKVGKSYDFYETDSCCWKQMWIYFECDFEEEKKLI